MVKKIIGYLILAGIVGGIIYGYLTYAMVFLYDKENPKISYILIVPKPERSLDFLYDHVDKQEMDDQIKYLKWKNKPIPWHMNYDEVFDSAIYSITMDNRPKD